MDDLTCGLALQYGNPGPATYSSANQEWNYARHPRPSQIISYTGHERQVVAPSAAKSPVARRRKDKDVNTLLEDFPELISVVPSFEREEELSQTVQEADVHFNPQISSVLEFGNVQLSEYIRTRRGRMKTVPIAAFASGQNQNILSLRIIESERVITDLEQDAAFRLPTIGCSKAADWICTETPIRQIKFADSIENPGDLLAVRLLSSTAIFQPIYHREAQPINPPGISNLPYCGMQISHIDPCLVAEIDISQTGGFTHVDVTFNPWYMKQFAIIDERGYWSIWQLHDIVRLENGVTPELLHSGFLPCDPVDGDEGESSPDEVNYDTWGKIEWVRDVNTFLVCGRRNAMLCFMEGTTTTSCNIEMNWQSSTEWILDVKTYSVHNSLIYILTTARILCFDFKVADQEAQPIRPQLAWLHYRDADDLTLRLTSLIIGEEYYLLLYSRLDSCILAFHVPIEGDEYGNCSVSDPFYVYVPSKSNTNGLKTIRYESPIKQILFKEVDQQVVLSKRVTLDNCPRFMKLFVVDSTLAIHEYLYSKPCGLPSAGDLKMGREALLLGAVSLLRDKRKRTRDGDSSDEQSDNGDVEYDDIHMPSHRSGPVETRSAPVTVDFTKIYSLLSNGDPSEWARPSVSRLAYQSFRDYVEHLTAAVTNFAEEGHPFVHTMLDIMDHPPFLSDIDDSSHELDWFRSRFAPMEPSAETTLCYLPLHIQSERSPGQVKIRSLQPFSVLVLYEKLVRDWLSNLSQSLPSRIRISKEKLIRQVSLELSLAGTVQIDASVPDSISVVSSQPSLAGRGSSTASQGDFEDGVDHSAERNKQITHSLLDLKTVSPTSMNHSVGVALEDVLSLWNVGGDPNTFDSDRALATETADGELSSRSRSGSQQRTRTRSRSRPNSVSARSIRSSPIIPSVQLSGGHSQFDDSRLPIRSSQFLPSSQITDSIPMTQVERGVFGSRQSGKNSNVKARKKKRAAGF